MSDRSPYADPHSPSPARTPGGPSTRQDTGAREPQVREPPQQSTLRSGSVQWHVPIYNANAAANDAASLEEFPIRRPSAAVSPFEDPRRDSASSAKTLAEEETSRKYSLSSYEHPYDITPPRNAYSGTPSSQIPPLRSALRRSVSFAKDPPHVKEYDEDDQVDAAGERASKRRGVLSNMMDLYALEHDLPNTKWRPQSQEVDAEDEKGSRDQASRLNGPSTDSTAFTESEFLDPDDPRITGVTLKNLEDEEEIERNTMRLMDYKSRRKHLLRAKIEFNVSSMITRQEFLLKLARALMTFGAPSHRIESQLIAAARILEVEAEFIHLPGVIICSFGEQELGCSETQFIKCSGRLALGPLHKVHYIYRSVVHDEISAGQATQYLEELINAPPMYSIFTRCLIAFSLSALICPLAFGGSFLDLWLAGGSAFVLAILQLVAASQSEMYANVFEITIAIFVSFAARGLSSIRSQIFCYSAISSASIIGILPGYLILSSSLELASKNIVCGSVKMVYALIYTLFLGFGLQIGSDFYFLFDPGARQIVDRLSGALNTAVDISGSWAADNDTVNASIPNSGTWTFLHALEPLAEDVVQGCYRMKGAPWYLRPMPIWYSFIIVPLFSFLSSLGNMQPIRSQQTVVMVVISCCAYTTNKIANHYIFNRSDVVSAIGAFTVGVLGNIYSRKMGGTAFTSMVTGVLFLVPSGLSQAGGISADGSGISIGTAMIAVTIGITVGLFMSQALVYMFGQRKNAAVFSF